MNVTLPAAALAALEMDGSFIDRLGLDMARPRAVLGEIMADGPAAQAGLKTGDLIEKINGEPVADGVAFVERVRQAPGQRLVVEGVRNGQAFNTVVVPIGERRGDLTAGKIRAQVDMRVEQATLRYGPFDAVGKGIEKTWNTGTMTLKMLGKMLIGETSIKNITGPITIADYAGQTARIGLISFLSFIAFISISLGVMNLLPIPVLDGGHLLYYSLEVLTGRRLPERVGEIAQRAGLGVLMALMAVAIFNDIARLIS
jgi:regulator of sigma E protease